MGHLVNPTAFRLGFFNNWKDNWITNGAVAYSELLHNTNTIKDIIHDYLHRSLAKTPIIFSHFNMEQLHNDRLSLRIYYYDSDIEFKYRDLRYACRRIYNNQRRLYKSFYKLHLHMLLEFQEMSKQEKANFFYLSLAKRGFFEYLLLRKLIFLFLCAMVRDKTFKKKPALLLQIKVGVYSLLEYNWRKNLFLGKPLNFFEFFIGVFIQMQFIEQEVASNAIRASLMFFQKQWGEKGASKKKFGKNLEIVFLLKWFKLGRMTLIQKLLEDEKVLSKFSNNWRLYSKSDSKNLKKESSLIYNVYKNEFNTVLSQRKQWAEQKRKYLLKRQIRKKSNVKFGWLSRYTSSKERVLPRTPIFFRRKKIGVLEPMTSKIKSYYEHTSFGYIERMTNLFYWLSAYELDKFTSLQITYSKRFLTLLKTKAMSKGHNQNALNFFIRKRPNTEFKEYFTPSFLNGKRQEDLSDTVEDVSNWSLLAYAYIKYSHNLWSNSSTLLRSFLKGRYLAYYNSYSLLAREWVSMSIWAVHLFLDFYRIFLARVHYIYRFGFSKLYMESKLNRMSIYPIELDFFGFDNDWVTAPFVAFYLSRKFEQDFKIKELFKPIGRDLRRIITKTPFLLGYKLQFVGRLTRRDRLRTSWVMGGRVPLSTMSANVEYGRDFGILRNGVCSVKVWLYRPRFVGDPAWTYLYKVVF